MKRFRILYDTNILFEREDAHVVSNDLLKLSSIINELTCNIIIHPLSINDISRDQDISRRNVSLSKVSTYKQLEKYPKYENDEKFQEIVGSESKENDKIDNHLIYAVLKNACDFLITMDKGILTKSKKLGLEDKILDIKKAVKILETFIPQNTISNLLPCFTIQKGWNIDLKDEIFGTLKGEYTEFNDWWQNKVCRTDRDVYVYIDENGEIHKQIKAILVLKKEDAQKLDCTPSFSLQECMKICLFKVSENTRGMKLGERLLKMAFEQSHVWDLKDIYLTHFTVANDNLVKLIKDFGFTLKGKNLRNEEIYHKQIKPSSQENIENVNQVFEINNKYFPSFYDGQKVNKFLIPIIPYFHKKLFPEYKQNSQIEQLMLFNPYTSFSSEGFCIKKAYVCSTGSRLFKKGDIALFYRTEDVKAITTLGTIEEVFYKMDNPQEVWNKIKRRTVYTIEEITEICQNKKKATIILFKHNLNFMHDVTYKYLLDNEIVTGPIQSITQVKSEKDYRKIKENNIDASLIIN